MVCHIQQMSPQTNFWWDDLCISLLWYLWNSANLYRNWMPFWNSPRCPIPFLVWFFVHSLYSHLEMFLNHLKFLWILNVIFREWYIHILIVLSLSILIFVSFSSEDSPNDSVSLLLFVSSLDFFWIFFTFALWFWNQTWIQTIYMEEKMCSLYSGRHTIAW